MKINSFKTGWPIMIDWFGNHLVDWRKCGTLYTIDGEIVKEVNRSVAFSSDKSISSPDSRYAFLYQRLGTKGILMKDGSFLREINRPYYYADTHEYPAAFIHYNDRTYLVHCPRGYDILDFEDVETGELITNVHGRTPPDFFHSILRVSDNQERFLSCGWVWHPWDQVQLFNTADCLNNPAKLDKPIHVPDNSAEICTADFIDNDKIVLYASSEDPINDEVLSVPPSHLCVWDIINNNISHTVKPECELGNIYAISENLIWDMYKFPKIIDIETGKIVTQAEHINSGEQNSPIMAHSQLQIQIAFNKVSKQIAVRNNHDVYVLTP